MLIHFSQNKCQYHNGQLTPFFIAVLVILVIIALVTVNIGKISLTKTHTANACDAGALAGAAVMAKIYESLKDAKETMIEAWEQFYEQMVAYLLIGAIMRAAIQLEVETGKEQLEYALYFLTLALYMACRMNCESDTRSVFVYAVGGAGSSYFIANAYSNFKTAKTMAPYLTDLLEDLKDGLNSYWEGMQGSYAQLKESVNDGHESAVEAAYKLAFVNSGIGSKLNEEQQDDFEAFLEDPDDDSDERPAYISGNYSWVDGQNRNHSVNVAVNISRISTYIFVCTALTKSALDALFDEGIAFCETLEDYLTNTYGDIVRANDALLTAFIAGALMVIFCWIKEVCEKCEPYPPCVICAVVFYILWIVMKIVWIAALIVCMAYIIYQLATYIPDELDLLDDIQEKIDAIEAGLAPSRTVPNPGNDEVLCYLTSVPHDRLVRVTSNQLHEGKSYALWNVSYPNVRSSATAVFGGASNSLSTLNYTANLISVD